MYTHQANRYTQFITPLGAIIALACFFMPWTEMVRIRMTFSGFTWSKSSPLIGIALIANLAIVGLSLYMIIRNTSWRSKALIFIISGIGIAALLQAYLHFKKLVQTVETVEITGEFGFWGTVIGFAIAAVGVFLTRAEEMEERSEMFVDERYAWFIAHAAGIGALACFFTPWKGIGAVSGFDLAKWNPLIAVALIASVTIVVVNLYMLKRGTLWKSKVPVLVSSGIGLGVIFSYYINYFAMLNTANKTGIEIRADTLEFGLWGTLIGFIVTAVGMLLIKTEDKHKQAETPTESG